MFQRATKSYLIKQNSGLNNEDLVRAFRDADTDNSGSLSLEEVRNIFRYMGQNSELPEEDVIEYFKSLDLDEDGQVTLEEFQRVFNEIQ
jgi:Ca2+-binding EF-hand superfamily protein